MKVFRLLSDVGSRLHCVGLGLLLAAVGLAPLVARGQDPNQAKTRFDIDPPRLVEDKSVQYDYDIVYVRSPRWVEGPNGKRAARWAEFAHTFAVNAGTDLMLLRPDGSEEVLVAGGEGAVQDPYVSFDGQWVYYTLFHKAGDDPNSGGADIYKIHIPSRKIVQLTQQEFTPNKEGPRPNYGVYNMHPCPIPGGRVAFVSNRNAYLPPPKSYPAIALQLHIMDDDGKNVETIGHLNLAGALHPVILKDGRILFSSLENMGLRNYILWGIWSIHPDGTNWGPVVSALHGHSSPSSWHFQTQLSDENIVVELYYNQNQKGFGSLFKLPPQVPEGSSAFGPGDDRDPRNTGFPLIGAKQNSFRVPFTPYRMESLTPWIRTNDFPAWPSVWEDQNSPRIGKVTHPSGVPDNHLLLAWTLGPIGGSAGAVREYMQPQPIDSGIYLMKDGKQTWEPGELRLIKNDPNYNEQWPRALVPYKRVYGVDEPRQLVHKNDGKASPELPEGTPFGLVGTSSMYKRESAPLGAIRDGGVTATSPDSGSGQFNTFTGSPWNWQGQGADAGIYDNSEIHAIRIISFEPNAQSSSKNARFGYPPYDNHAMERLRILGEIPVRKFGQGEPGASATGGQPLDPDGNPDTSFLAKIPADVAFTFQTIDKDGMVLNMAQTWHQVRPGEIRNNCGGCHAHSQQPTLFEETFAARPEYKFFDLTKTTPLVTAKSLDESKQKWDAADETGLRFENVAHDVEYRRDVRPILQRSCMACHTKSQGVAAAGLVLDDDNATYDNLPGTYFRLAGDDRGQFSPRKVEPRGAEFIVRGLFHNHMASHYIWKFQSRRSLLAWKIYGRRLDGWTNEEIAGEEITPADPRYKQLAMPGGGAPPEGHRYYLGDIDFTGSQMPPAEAVAGTYRGPGGKTIKVAPLSDEDRRTIVRWIDLGCPIDLDPDFDPQKPQAVSQGFLADDQRPTLALTYPVVGNNEPLRRILVGMFDYNAGLDETTFTVTADFPVDGVKPGENLAGKFQALPGSRWELKLAQPIADLPQGMLTVSVKDRQGNTSRIERVFSVGQKP